MKYREGTIIIDCGNASIDDHVFHSFLSYDLSFPSLMPVTSLITPTNDGPVLRGYTCGFSKYV